MDVLPGASAVSAALAVSGLPSHQFTFVGFPPRKAGERKRFLQSLSGEPRTLVLFEAPHRVRATLREAVGVFGPVVSPSAASSPSSTKRSFAGLSTRRRPHFAEPRGEFTLVIEGAEEGAGAGDDAVEAARRLLTSLARAGATGKDSVAQAVEAFGVPRRAAYRLWVEAKDAAAKADSG